MKSPLLRVLIFFSTFFALSGAQAQDYYVSATGSNNNNGLTPQTPFATIQKAGDVVGPGGTVYIMNGTYERTTFGAVLTMTRSGTAQAYITFKPFAGHNPIITAREGSWASMVIDGSYIVVDGLEFIGDNANLNYDDAYQAYLDNINKVKSPQARYNTNAISFGSNADVHHLIFRNLKIHDFPGAGVGGGRCDYVTIENNTIYNNCWYMMYAGSGISFLDPKSIDSNTGYKIFIRNNVVHNNKTLVPWSKIQALSDGNGIILDVNVGNGTTVLPYVGRYLVENNLVYNNGGGGIHGYKAAHVDIINNTAYNNGTVVGYPEIDANQCSDFKIYNNIMYARTGGNANGNDANTIYDYNVYFNGPFFKKGPNDITGVNPEFVNQSTSPATADFRLKNTSPAINNGSNIADQFSPKDILGVSRPVGFSTDMGAYEYATVIPRTEVVLKQGNTAIIDNTGTFDFGDVSSTAPKTVTFTIQNIGDQALTLSGSPKVVTTGTGFSVAVDAPATVAANGSATFQVTLTATTTGVYTGTVSIANDDADENPYNFAITGYGYDGTKVLQTITFNTIPTKVIGAADFDGNATSSAGLPITYTSSNTNVATIVAGKIHLVNPGTSTITASQAGDASTNVAKNVTQLLTVTPVLPPPGTNLITNPTFDANVTDWSPANKNGATSTFQSVTQTGYTTNVGKLTPTFLGNSNVTGSDNIQIGTNIFLVNGRNYLITFTASADAARNLRVELLRNSSPFSAVYAKTQAITTTPTRYGSFAFTSNFTGSVAFRFFVGGNLNPVYVNDVEIIEEPQAAPTITAVSKSGNTVTITGTGFVGASEVSVNTTPATAFTVVSGTSITATTSQTNLSSVKVISEGGTVTYTVPAISNLSALSTSAGALSPVFASGTTNYATPSVANSVSSATITPVLEDAVATLTVNGVTTVSGNAATVNLSTGSNAIPIVVTAQNGSAKTYTITINRAVPLSTIATLTSLTTSAGTLSPTFASGTLIYTAPSAASTTASVTVTPTVTDANATVKVNGTTVVSGNASGAIPLNAGANSISVVVTAQDGVATTTYTINVNKILTVTLPGETVKINAGISPNGDGVNDHLIIDNIASFTDNKLTIVTKTGVTVFESSGYDNVNNVFKGLSKKSNEFLPAGTYYYLFTYRANGIMNKKTGYIILKY